MLIPCHSRYQTADPGCIFLPEVVAFSLKLLRHTKANRFSIHSDKGKFVVLCSPNIEHAHGYEKYGE